MSNGDQGIGTGTLVFAFVAGAAVGAAAAMLTTPRRGEEVRDTLRRIPHATHNAYSRATAAARDAFVEAYNAELDQVGAEPAPAAPGKKS